MSETQKMVLSALLTTGIAGLGAFLGAASEIEPPRDVADMRTITWLIIIATGVMAGLKDLRTFVQGKKAAISSASANEE